jgi:hypothetical protein
VPGLTSEEPWFRIRGILIVTAVDLVEVHDLAWSSETWVTIR